MFTYSSFISREEIRVRKLIPYFRRSSIDDASQVIFSNKMTGDSNFNTFGPPLFVDAELSNAAAAVAADDDDGDDDDDDDDDDHKRPPLFT